MRAFKLYLPKIAIYSSFIVMALILHYFPQIDIFVSNLFYDPKSGFLDQSSTIIVYSLHFVKLYCACWVIGVAVSSLTTLSKTKSFNLRHYIKEIYICTVFLIGPGVLIHYAIKEIFSRPRPFVTTLYGGDAAFTPAFSVNHVASDAFKSFVSGHAAAGFMLIALAMLFNGKQYRILLCAGIALGLAFGLIRISIGYHFFSDVVCSGMLIYLLSDVLSHYFKIKPSSRLKA